MKHVPARVAMYARLFAGCLTLFALYVLVDNAWGGYSCIGNASVVPPLTSRRFWLGLVLPSAIVFSAWTFIVWRVVLIYFKYPKRRNHCGQCGYNLTGNVSGVCPECGTKCPGGVESVARESA